MKIKTIRKQKIIIEQNQEGLFKITPVGFATAVEVCEVLIPSVCQSLTICANTTGIPIELLKESAIAEISKLE